MRIKPKKIDTYLFVEVLGPFLGGLVFFLFVFLMFQLLRLAEFFIIHGVDLLTLAEMTGLLMVSFLPMGLPIAFLIGVLVAFGRLSSDSELVALKAHGVSLRRMSVPVLLLAVVISGLSFGLNTEWVPWTERTFKRMIIRVSNTKVASSIREGTFTSGFFDLLIYADKLDTDTQRMKHVFIFDEREPKNPLAVVAQEGEIVNVKADTRFGQAAMLRLYNGNIHSSNVDGGLYQKIDFDEYKLFLKIEEGSDTATIKPRMWNTAELKQKTLEAKPDSLELQEYRGEFWRRYAVAISPMIFVFLGIGFGTVRTRAVRAGAALIALVLIVIYWGIQATCTVLIHKGVLNPVLGMQLPNLVMALLGAKAFANAAW